MLGLSRVPFGRKGNLAPALVSWISLLGWETVTAVIAAYAEVSRFLLSEPFTLEDAKETVERRRGQTHPTEPGDALALVVEHQGAACRRPGAPAVR